MSTQQQSSGGRPYGAVFNSVTRAAAPLPSPAGRVASTDYVEYFIDAVDTAIDLAFDEPPVALLPDVDVPQPGAVLKAYLLFLATEGVGPGQDVEPKVFDGWYERVAASVWRLLGFKPAPPTKLLLSMAFSLLGNREHQAPELRALIWAVGDLAAGNLLPGLRR